jgi:hypothetical protein
MLCISLETVTKKYFDERDKAKEWKIISYMEILKFSHN